MRSRRPTPRRFRALIYDYYRWHGRSFPWRRTRDPYRILVSEIMLQQTQAERVVGYYKRFLKTFPDFLALARAPLRKVLAMWQGLGYNRRPLALKRLAEIVVRKYGGKLPRDPEVLEGLPGIGPCTAGAVRAFAWGLPEVFLETNIRTVYLHFFFPSRRKVSDAEILPYVRATLDYRNPRGWYWALMDCGAWLKRTVVNPSRRSSRHGRQPPFAGSRRELRGRIVRFMLHLRLDEVRLRRDEVRRCRGATAAEIGTALGVETRVLTPLLHNLTREGFLEGRGKGVYAIVGRKFSSK